MLNKIELPILITGASGFVGSNLLRFFISRGIKVNIILRKKSNIWRIKDIINGAKIFYVDLKEKENLFLNVHTYIYVKIQLHVNANTFVLFSKVFRF